MIHKYGVLPRGARGRGERRGAAVGRRLCRGLPESGRLGDAAPTHPGTGFHGAPQRPELVSPNAVDSRPWAASLSPVRASRTHARVAGRRRAAVAWRFRGQSPRFLPGPSVQAARADTAPPAPRAWKGRRPECGQFLVPFPNYCLYFYKLKSHEPSWSAFVVMLPPVARAAPPRPATSGRVAHPDTVTTAQGTSSL